MLESILKKLQNKGITNVVLTSKCAAFENELSLEYEYIEDVRSAVFNAYGRAKMGHSPVVVIVDEDYLPSTYTAMTEAWFQRTPIIVLSYNSHNVESSYYLNRCVDATFFVDNVDRIDQVVEDVLNYSGPTLVKIKERFDQEESIDYSQIIESLGRLSDNSLIICYNGKNLNNTIKNIEPKYKYGILSKLLGFLSGGKDCLLCIPEDLLSLDSNIFNIRNLPRSFKLIVKNTGNNYWQKFEKWIAQNDIRTVVLEQGQLQMIEQELKKSPIAIFVK